MTLLTKREAEELVKKASSIALLPTTTGAIQSALGGNSKDLVVLLLKK